MAIMTIQYEDKEQMTNIPSILEKNKCTANNLNEIKRVVNNNANEMSSLTGVPIGTVVEYAGTTAPTGWLICDGSEISRADYANLFSIIGENYGSGDGSSTFNIPNIKGKTPVGVDTSDSDFNVIGKTGGSKKHSHKYGIRVGGYYHVTNFGEDSDAGLYNYDSNNNISYTNNTTNGQNLASRVNNSVATSLKSASVNYYNTEARTSYESIVQPYITLNYIIKT